MKSSISEAGALVASRSRSPHVSQPRRRLPTASMVGVRRPLAQVLLQRRRGLVRLGEQVAARESLALVERLQDQRFLLRAHPLHRANPAVDAGFFEIVERSDIEIAIERRHRLRTHALQPQQIEDGRGELGDEIAMHRGVARLGNLADARGEILADAGNLPQAGLVEPSQIVRVVARDVGAVAVGADLERILALDLEQVGDLPENARDRGVIQTAALRFRFDSRAASRRPTPAPTQSRRARPAGRSRTGSRRRRRRTPWRRWRRPRWLAR